VAEDAPLQRLRVAIDEEMARDDTVCVFGVRTSGE